jgi:hypothetical protein
MQGESSAERVGSSGPDLQSKQWKLLKPRKALRGGISGAFLEPLVRFCQHLASIAHV